jgi:uncharacterized membrane protein YkoI
MHKPHVPCSLALIVSIVITATSCFAAGDKPIELTQLPRAVQRTVKEQLAGGSIAKIHKRKSRGRVVFGVECAKGEKKWQVEVAPDGKLLLRADETALSDTPAAVQKTIRENAGKGKIESIESVAEAGQQSYEAAVVVDGQARTLIVAADGKLLDIEMGEEPARPPRSNDVGSETPPGGEHQHGYGR